MRLIDTRKTLSFKNWIKQHNPQANWNFNDPAQLREQFVRTVKETGDIDLRSIYNVMFALEEPGTTINQT